MPIETQAIENLSADDLKQDLLFLAEFLKPEFPSQDLQPGGVLYEEMLRPAGAIFTLATQNLRNLKKSNSVPAVLENPENAEADAVDLIASNYGITRKAGTISSGQVTVIVSGNNLTMIPSSLVLTSNGVEFTPTSSFAGLPTDQTISDEDKESLLVTRNDGTYAFVISVEASTEGVAGNISKDARFTASSTIIGVVDYVATSDFSGGDDNESVDSLIERLRDGVTTPSLSNRSSTVSLIRNAFPEVVDVSLIGAGDDEMLRDSHTVISGKTLGKVDVYVRTAAKPLKITATITAKLQDTDEKLWVIDFDRDAYPGFYRVESVLNVDSVSDGTLEIVSLTRGTDSEELDGIDITPAMEDASESTFSRYQTASLLFKDTVGDEDEVGDEKDYTVTLLVMPQIAEINDWLLSRPNHPPASDYLVKAPIPCLVAIGIEIFRGRGETTPDTDAIKTAVSDAVNNIDFATGAISSSVITTAVQEHLSRRARVSMPVAMRGEILFPDGTSGWIFDNNELKAPDRPEYMCSTRTVAYYLPPESVTVTVREPDAKSV